MQRFHPAACRILFALFVAATGNLAARGAATATPTVSAAARASSASTVEMTGAVSDETVQDRATRFFDPLLADAKTDVERASLLHQRGVLYLRSSYRAQAIADLTASLHLMPVGSPERLDVLFHRACAYLLLPTPDAPAALADISVCVAAKPTDAEAWLVRADALRKLGNYAQANADLARAIRLAPQGDPTLRALLSNAQNAVP